MPSVLSRRWVHAGFAVAVLAAVELGSALGLQILARRGVAYQAIAADRLSEVHRRTLEDLLAGRPSLFIADPLLGWSLRPGFKSELCTVDGAGLRRDAGRPQPLATALRVAVFGDSFTFGGDVADRFAYPEALVRLDAGLDVANFGVPAYGLDQAFLRYQKEGRQMGARVVVIGFMSENIARTMSVFRPFYTPATLLPLSKPRYVLRHGELVLVDNPLPEPDDYRRLLAHPAEVLATLGRDDLFFRTRSHASPLDRSAAVRLARLARQRLLPDQEVFRRDGTYNPEGAAFEVTAALFKSFHDLVLQDGAQPVILIFPESGDLARWRGSHTKRYEPLLRVLSAAGYRVVDAMDALDGASARPAVELVPTHLSPLANELVAAHLLARLREFGLVP